MEVLPFILLAALGFIGVLQLFTKYKLRSLENKPAPEFTDVLGAESAHHRRIMIYFYSNHCPPCRRISPIVDGLAQTHNNVYKVNASDHSELAWRFNIIGTPSIVVVEDGQIKHMMVGNMNARRLQELLDADYITHDAAHPAG